MTIDLYPELIRQEDLSPDQGFGPDIDEDCNVSAESEREKESCSSQRTACRNGTEGAALKAQHENVLTP